MSRLKKFSKFFVPSLIGAITFLFPIRYEGNITILMAVLSDGLLKILGDKAPIIVLTIVAISAVASLWFSLKNHRLKDLQIIMGIQPGNGYSRCYWCISL